MPYTRMEFRSGWLEESETTPIVRENIVADEQSREARHEFQYQLPDNYKVLKRIPTLTTIDKPTKTIKTPSTRIDELLKRSAEDSPRPTTTHNNLVPHWSYQKNSLAVACVLSAITVLAIIFLSVLTVRKIRRSWKRHKRERKDYDAFKHRTDVNKSNRNSNACCITKSKSSRESMMYSRDNSPSGGYVVEQTGGSVTRVYREGNNVSSQTFDSIGASPEQRSPPCENKRTLGGRADSRTPSGKGRAGSIPRPIVVVPSPLRHVSSQKATPVMQSTSSSTPDSEQPPVSPASLQDPEPAGRTSNRNSLLRLPSIKKSISPLFSL
ncbi:hypothetical protein BDV38DRAFT_284925 [Aspergillus pseudotamarii]|uniref:Uncharacterized protein n=1 Tax=Aspergillus pseudotamarii TaxID=132259 RepID=A0A5N6SLD7_ASPPS|nr:uncharacterized protein BDV38DRAFT_284925 [Aspergillus pseudotamarii]KAE8135492.1 hypothetical protein BDV38DRAFT_284925 [Aspergillus pseudotamarii]